MSDIPYATLEPQIILDAVDSVGYRTSGSLLALNSFENRVYQVGIEDDKPIIAKFYRPHRWSSEAIQEEHQFSLELIQHEIPVVAPLANEKNETLHTYNDFRFALFPRQGGRALELENLDQLEWMGRFIGRLHAVGACKKFQYRQQLTVTTLGQTAYEFLTKNNFIPNHLFNAFCKTTESLLKLIQERFDSLSNVSSLRLHGDCHPGNVLWNDQGPRIVDLDDCLQGPAIQDIWMLLSGTPEQMNLELSYILEGYNEFFDFNYNERHLIEALRALRLLHYSGWLAKRWNDPAFPLNFPWFNTPHYWEEQLGHLNDQVMLLSEEF